MVAEPRPLPCTRTSPRGHGGPHASRICRIAGKNLPDVGSSITTLFRRSCGDLPGSSPGRCRSSAQPRTEVNPTQSESCCSPCLLINSSGGSVHHRALRAANHDDLIGRRRRGRRRSGHRHGNRCGRKRRAYRSRPGSRTLLESSGSGGLVGAPANDVRCCSFRVTTRPEVFLITSSLGVLRSTS